LSLDLFFSFPGKEFLDFRESILAIPDNRPIVSGIIATCCSVLAVNRLLVCFTTAIAPLMDGCETKDSGVSKFLGDRCFCHWALITLHWPSSGNAATSICLYRKQERLLFASALEQTSSVPSRVASFHMYSRSLPMSLNTCMVPE